MTERIAEVLSDLAELADEIEGATIPPGMFGRHSVTLHTTSQVQEWLARTLAAYQVSGKWNPWEDA